MSIEQKRYHQEGRKAGLADAFGALAKDLGSNQDVHNTLGLSRGVHLLRELFRMQFPDADIQEHFEDSR